MSLFERWLTLSVFLCIVAGIALGQALPGPVQMLGAMEMARVNAPVGLLIWVMIIPMLLKRVGRGAGDASRGNGREREQRLVRAKSCSAVSAHIARFDTGRSERCASHRYLKRKSTRSGGPQSWTLSCSY